MKILRADYKAEVSSKTDVFNSKANELQCKFCLRNFSSAEEIKRHIFNCNTLVSKINYIKTCYENKGNDNLS